LGPKVLKTGFDIVNDVSRGEPIVSAVKKEGREQHKNSLMMQQKDFTHSLRLVKVVREERLQEKLREE